MVILLQVHLTSNSLVLNWSIPFLFFYFLSIFQFLWLEINSFCRSTKCWLFHEIDIVPNTSNIIINSYFLLFFLCLGEILICDRYLRDKLLQARDYIRLRKVMHSWPIRLIEKSIDSKLTKGSMLLFIVSITVSLFESQQVFFAHKLKIILSC